MRQLSLGVLSTEVELCLRSFAGGPGNLVTLSSRDSMKIDVQKHVNDAIQLVQ